MWIVDTVSQILVLFLKTTKLYFSSSQADEDADVRSPDKNLKVTKTYQRRKFTNIFDPTQAEEKDQEEEIVEVTFCSSERYLAARLILSNYLVSRLVSTYDCHYYHRENV